MIELLRETLTGIKSEFLSFCISSLNSQNNYSAFISMIQVSLNKHFDIEEFGFLLLEGEDLKPVCINSSFEINVSEMTWINISEQFKQKRLTEIPQGLFEKSEFTSFSHMLRLKVAQSETQGIILLKSTPKWEAFSKSEYFKNLADDLSNIFNNFSKGIDVRQIENQYRKLYNMTDLFHSTMDIDLILENVLITIQENFPNFNVELILSNDQDRQTKVHIKPFDYLSERPSVIEAFVSGKITIEQAADLNYCLLNAPIKGRQAIYGILQVSAPFNYMYSKAQQEFIRMLAHTSGNALENAKLYHQSYRLISDLQLINETSHRLNMKLDINEMFMYLQKQLMKSFQPLELCFVLNVENSFKLTDASTDFFKTDEGVIYINYVAKHFEKSQEPLFIADFSRMIGEDIQYKSMMAIPMLVEQRINGFSIVLHRDSYFFSFDSFKLMQSLIHHSSLAIANSILRNQLQEMVDSDHLTNLFARSYLDKFVEHSLENDNSGMFLLIDIDNFKRVNDTYGHQVGDEILVQIGSKLMDIVSTRGICARWGGEEIAVYVPNMLEDEAFKLAKRIVDTIPEATNPVVTVSAGLITWDVHNREEFQSIFLRADTALYYAKENGKNRVCVFDESML